MENKKGLTRLSEADREEYRRLFQILPRGAVEDIVALGQEELCRRINGELKEECCLEKPRHD